MQPHPLQLPHYMLTFQGHEASPIYLFNSAGLVFSLVALKGARSQLQQEMTYGGVASSRIDGKFSKSKVGPKKKIRPGYYLVIGTLERCHGERRHLHGHTHADTE